MRLVKSAVIGALVAPYTYYIEVEATSGKRYYAEWNAKDLVAKYTETGETEGAKI